MKYTLLALATAAILAQQVPAKPSKPIPGCLEKFTVPETGYAEGGCCLLAKQKGVTFEDLLYWNTDLRKDCLNLDVGNDICVKGPPKKAGQSPVLQALCSPPAMSSQAVTANPATNNNTPMPQAASTNTDTQPPKPQVASANAENQPQPKAARPLYPSMVPPKAAQQQQQPPKPVKPMTQGPKSELVRSPVPAGASQSPNPSYLG